MTSRLAAIVSTKGKTSRQAAEELIAAVNRFQHAAQTPQPQPEPKPPAA